MKRVSTGTWGKLTGFEPGERVGAGDAFAAATIIGVGLDRPMDEILDFAVRFASQTCTIQGATATDRNHYTEFDL